MILTWASCSTPRKQDDNTAAVHLPPPESPPPVVQPPPPPVLTKPVPLPTWIAWDPWCQAHGLNRPKRLVNGFAASYEVQTKTGRLQLDANSRLAHWNSIGFNLGYAPLWQEDQFLVHTVDAHKNLLPLLNNAAPKLPPNPVIVIDPGHGGKNPGAKSILSDKYEKDFTLDWALRIQKLLQPLGWRVHLTRTNDVDIALTNRVAYAGQVKADLFISLHFNSAYPLTEPAGIETYCLTPQGLPSSVTRDFEDAVGRTYPNNAFDAENLRCALELHEAMLAGTGAQDRNVRRARFLAVLRLQDCPAVLVEGGFLSNPTEARLIAGPDYRQSLAQSVARALFKLSPAAGGIANTAAP